MISVRNVALFVACWALLASANSYFVSTTGSDANSGTQTAPFRTIPYAFSKLTPGDVAIVKPGIYSEYKAGYGIHLDRSGTATVPITLKSETPGGAIIDLLNKSDSNHGLYVTGSYITIEGFKIRNAFLGGVTIYGSYVKLIGNEICNNGNGGDPASAYGQDGIFSSQWSSGNVYSNNNIHHNGRISINTNLDHGLYLCGNNETVVNNLITYNASFGIHIVGYDTVRNMKVYNNVMAFNGRSGGIIWKPVSGVEIKNNIFYKNARYGFDVYYSSGPGVVFENNMFYGNANPSPMVTVYPVGSITITETRSITADPLFVNETGDFHLKAGSPAINAGLNLTSAGVTKDYAGTTRPQGSAFDIGAFEYVTGPSVEKENPAVVGGLGALTVRQKGKGAIFIRWTGSPGASASVYSARGEQISSFKVIGSEGVMWNSLVHPAGVYMVRAKSGKVTHVAKVYTGK